MPIASTGGAQRGPGSPRGLASVLACAVLLIGCGKQAKEVPASSGYAVEETYERGPVKLVLRIDKDELTIAERIRLELEVTADENYAVKLPSFGDKLEQFGIVDYSTTQPELVGDGKLKQTRSYVLEPFLSGEYVIPPMVVTFKQEGGADEAGEGAGDHQVETEEVKIQVKSLLAEDQADLKIHEIVAPVALPESGKAWLWWTLGGSLAVLCALLFGVIWFARRRRPRETPVPTVPAHELAYQQLEALIADDLPGKGEIKPFYQRISDILRHYIENRFGLHAPEQTTEEFLSALSENDSLQQDHKPLLKRFLEHCDLVKFAQHHPTTDDIQATFDACKNFIGETRSDKIAVPQPAASPDSTR